MGKLSAILPAVAAASTLAIGGCATEEDLEALRSTVRNDVAALRSDIASLRASVEAGGRGTGGAATPQAAAPGPPPAEYRKVSTLVDLPEFMPGLGTLYVQPQTLPAGPFLAYDRDGRLVSTVFMIPVADVRARKAFERLPVGGRAVQEVDLYYTPGHPGVEQPHYHHVLWHVPKDAARME